MKCTLRDRRSSLETISGPREGLHLFESCSEARTQKQRVSSRARLHILVPRLDRESLPCRKTLDVRALDREPYAATALFLCTDTQIPNSG
jgi:hypothetical protein